MKTTDNDHARNQLISLWAIQDSLLQQYRLIFIATETILVSATAFIPKESFSWIFLFFIAGLIVIFVWVFVCKFRGACVAFVQWMILRAEKDLMKISRVTNESIIEINIMRPVTAFKEFQKNYGNKKYKNTYLLVLNDEFSGESFNSLENSITRTIFEIGAPLFYGVIWIVILLRSFRIKI